MGPKSGSKKTNKARKPGQDGKGKRRPLVSPIVATRTAAPTTPIPALTVLTSRPELKTVNAADPEARTLKKWCFDRTPVHYSPTEPWPSTSLNKGALVELTGQKQNVSVDGTKTLWWEIAYESYDPRAGTQWVTGWVNDAYLDTYEENFPNSGVVIPNPTPNPRDAQQYMILEGKARYNLCGELCVAFLVGGDIDSVLMKWKTNSPNSYNAILAGGRDNPTSENDLRNMLNAILGEYGYDSDADQLVSLRNKLTYPVTPGGLLADLQNGLVTHSLICGVTINDSGELIGKENPRIKHWVVLDKIKRNGNRVEVYNPFPNKREEYSFAEFYRSCSTNSGMWVKRKRASTSSHVQDLPTFEVAIANPNPLYRAAQYIDVEGKKKTNLCGEFCVAFILKESIEAVLERWKEVQPILYADIVGNNKGTGTFALTTLLKAYGYNSEGDIKEFLPGLTDPCLKKSLVSPGRIAQMLETHYLIAGVNIDGLTGKLKTGDDVRHWVVVDKLTPVGKNRGWVELYNPFPNCWEEYSYSEFTASVGYWSGLWVKREIIPVYVEQVVQDSNTEDQPRKKDSRIGQWTEGQLLEAIRRRSRSGRSLHKIAAELAELSGWKKWEIISRFKKVITTGKTNSWTESQLRREIELRIKAGKPANRISDELARKSGWKKREITNLYKSVREAQKWTEAQLIEAIREKLKTAKSINRVATELSLRSGWKIREVVSRIKKLIAASQWTEAHLREELERLLKTGKSMSKISAELVEPSGWKKWTISKMLKSMKELERTIQNKAQGSLNEEQVIVVDPSTIVHASQPLAEFVKWQNSLLSQSNSNLYRVRKWGDPIMVKYGFDVDQINSTNFQAVGLYNDGNREFGAISNFIRISHDEVMRLKAMQIEDNYVARKNDWRSQKMNWLCKWRGTIYFFDDESDQWQTAPFIRWGTLALGGNLVQVIGTQIVQAKMRDGVMRKVEVARLKGFTVADWGRPLDELLAQGLVHRCFCAYKSNSFGDTPKGIVYSPFYSVANRDFAGLTRANALYIPVEWLEPKTS